MGLDLDQGLDVDRMKAAGVSYRQLDYWTTQGWLRCDTRNPGSGRSRRWPESELRVAQTMVRLARAGVAVEVAAKVARGEAEIAPGVFVVVDPPADAAALPEGGCGT